MDWNITAGDTDQTIYVRLRDSTTGLAKTGLVYNSAGAVCSYVLPGAARAAITLATQTVTGAHSDGGFVEVDATNCKGLYRLDLPDAAIASGKYSLISIEFDGIIEETVIVPLSLRKSDVRQWLGTAAATPTVAGVPEVDVTHWLGTAAATPTTAGVPEVDVTYWVGSAATAGAIPAAAAGASGGLVIAGTNAPITFTGSGNAFSAISTGGNGVGMVITGNGSGLALDINGGSTSGSGIDVSVGTNGTALKLTGNGSGAGIDLDGGSTGDGFNIAGGAYGIYVAAGNNNPALRLIGHGSGAGLHATSATTGSGILVAGGGTSGNGITVTTTDGHALSLDATGTSKYGLVADTLNVTGALTAGTNAIPWNASWDAEVESEANDALVAIHLDHLLAADYDPASKPGTSTALLNELVESDAGVSRFTANALEQAPSGGGAVADWTADERTAIRSILGIPASGTTPEDVSAGILHVMRNYIDTEVAAIKAKTDNLPADPADASDIASSFSTVNSTLSTIASYIDTEVAAIKAKTDNLPASPAATGDIPSAATIADAVWDEATTGHVTAGTFGEQLKTDVDAILDDTGTSGVLLTSAYDFAKGTVAVTESYSTDGTAPTPVQALMLIMQSLTEVSISGTTWTVKKLDGSTTAATLTLDSATTPTSKTRSS